MDPQGNKILTEQEVLQGYVDVAVETLDGRQLKLRMTAVPWRERFALGAEFLRTGNTLLLADACMAKDADIIMSQLTIDSLGKVQRYGVALVLGEGLQKKMEQIGEQLLGTPTPSSSGPSSEPKPEGTVTPPPGPPAS